MPKDKSFLLILKVNSPGVSDNKASQILLFLLVIICLFFSLREILVSSQNYGSTGCIFKLSQCDFKAIDNPDINPPPPQQHRTVSGTKSMSFN